MERKRTGPSELERMQDIENQAFKQRMKVPETTETTKPHAVGERASGGSIQGAYLSVWSVHDDGDGDATAVCRHDDA